MDLNKYEAIFSQINVKKMIKSLSFNLDLNLNEYMLQLKESLDLNSSEEPKLKIYPYSVRPDQACDAVEMGFDCN